MVYQWKRNMAVPAQIAGEHLERLESQHGSLSTSLVVEDARPETALLHSCFEWDNTVAAEEYRKTQAGFILRNLITVNIVPNEETDEEIIEQSEVRAFVNVSIEENRGFVSVNTAMANRNMREQVLSNALLELNAFRRKYNQLEELSRIFEEIDNVLQV